MKRKLNWQIYAFSFLVTVLIFSLGFSIGLLIEKERLQAVDEINLAQNVDLKSLQLQQIYLESGEGNCEALNQLLEVNTHYLFESMNRVLEYSKKSMIDSELFEYQLREYFLTEIQFLLFSKEVEEECGSDYVTVVYFYDEDENDNQGNVLDYLKKKFDTKLLVFSFDSNFEAEPMIDIILTTYDVDQFPTVVVENVVYEGGLDAEALTEIICDKLGESSVHCLFEEENI